jgi:hypothetical protein
VGVRTELEDIVANVFFEFFTSILVAADIDLQNPE